MSTDDPKEGGYCIVKFPSDTYTFQDNVIIDERIITIGEQLPNACYLSRLIQGWKWNTDPLYCQTQPMILEMTIVIHPQLNVNIADDESKSTTYTCSWKVD